MQDYLSSRTVSDPLRLLDSVMFCDGANAVLMMRADTARMLGMAGQPGLASGDLNLVEAVRQMFGEAGPAQTREPRNALVTGIGGIAYGRGRMMSSALVLDV